MATVASVALPTPVGLAQRCDASSESDVDECWICLSSAGSLSRVCDCPRVSHRECLARWQLTNYGRREESFCRFCSKRLPALWKPDASTEAEKEELRVAPVMAVRYNGPEGTREFKLRVRPGPDGLATFKAHLKEILGFDVGPEFDVTFECQMPSTGSMLTLSGMNAYGAATHCAALLAATKTSTQTPTPTAATATQSSTLLQQQELHRGCTPLLQQQQESPQQQQQQQLLQQRSEGPELFLPSEVPSTVPTSLAGAVLPLTSAANATAAAALPTERLPHCSRRACQTGYLLHTTPGSAVQQLSSTWPYLSSVPPYMAPNLINSRTAMCSASRNRGSGPGIPRASSEAALSFIRYDSYDDLIPFGPCTEVFAPALPRAYLGDERVRRGSYINSSGSGNGNYGGRRVHFTAAGLSRQHHEAAVVDAEAERASGGRPVTAPGYSATGRFWSRVLPVAPLGVASPPVAPPAAATAPLASAAPALTPVEAVRSAPAAVLAGARSGPTTSTAAAATSLEASVPAVAVYDSRSDSVTDNVSSAASDGGSHTDLMEELLSLWPLAPSHPSGGGALGQKKSQKGRGGRQHLWSSTEVGNDDAAATSLLQPSAAVVCADAGTESRGRIRLPALIKRAARRAVDSLARVVMHRD